MTRLPASLHWSLPPSRPPAGDGCSTVRPTTLRRWCIHTPTPSSPWTIRAGSYGAALWLVLFDSGLLVGATGRTPPPPRPGGGGRLPTRCAGLRRRTPLGTRRLPRSLPGQKSPTSSDSGSPPHTRPRHGSPAFTAEPRGNMTFRDGRSLTRRTTERVRPGRRAVSRVCRCPPRPVSARSRRTALTSAAPRRPRARAARQAGRRCSRPVFVSGAERAAVIRGPFLAFAGTASTRARRALLSGLAGFGAGGFPPRRRPRVVEQFEGE